MRFFYLLVATAALLPSATDAFTAVGPTRRAVSFVRPLRHPLHAATGDDDFWSAAAGDDDFWSDYVPTERPAPVESRDGRGDGRGDDWGGDRPRRDGGSRHDYVRDTSADASAVDAVAVDALLSERLSYRKRGDFDAADDLRDRLQSEHAVSVNDRKKTWGTGSPYSSGGRSNSPGRGPRRPHRDFGPNGHDYAPAPAAGPSSTAMSEAEVHAAIAERLVAKLRRDFGTADRLQFELAGAGVFMDDRNKLWRADGVPFNESGAGDRPQSDRNRPYAQSRHSGELPEGADRAEVERRVAERDGCKKGGEYRAADALRDELLDTYGVVVDDRIREWSVGGSFGKHEDLKRATSAAIKNRSYARAASSRELPASVDGAAVQARIDARSAAKANRDFDQADAIRAELAEEHDIVFNDEIKMWSVGGDFGDDDPVKKRNAWTRRGGGDLSSDGVDAVEDLIAQRNKAKRDRNFSAADALRDRLRDDHNVRLDDRSREWRVDSDDYAYVPGGSALSEEDVAAIHVRVAARTAAKKTKDYETADRIRDALTDEFGVAIDDRTREWRAVGAGRGAGRFEEESRKSQSSPYRQSEEKGDDGFEAVFKEAFGSGDGPPAGPAAADGAAAAPESDAGGSGVVAIDVEPEVDTGAATAVVEIDAGGSGAVLVDVEPEAGTGAAVTAEELASLTIPLLKEKLRAAGKPVSGRKAELIERLLA